MGNESYFLVVPNKNGIHFLVETMVFFFFQIMDTIETILDCIMETIV